ncbi:hypothetical protein ACOMHN_040642 [Nucella lapillus]
MPPSDFELNTIIKKKAEAKQNEADDVTSETMAIMTESDDEAVLKTCDDKQDPLFVDSVAVKSKNSEGARILKVQEF